MNRPALDENYLRGLAIRTYNLPVPSIPGGQELLLPEIMSILYAEKITSIWLPFSCPALAHACEQSHARIETHKNPLRPEKVDALYLGTPTIVDDKVLFPETTYLNWHASDERETVRARCIAAKKAGARLIITGLGSGDIKVRERRCDMSVAGFDYPRVVLKKKFSDFTDWLIVSKRKENHEHSAP